MTRLEKFYNRNGIFLFNDVDSVKQHDELWAFRFKSIDVIKHRRVAKISQLYDIFLQNKSYGCKTPLEKYILLYGDKEGKIRYDNKKKSPNTLINFIKRHGKIEGEKKWKVYCEKQAYTNTFEYKSEKYGWSENQFKKYNKARSVTKENLISRHGVINGEIIWKNYCERQAYTNTKEYLKDDYERINKLKAINLDNMKRLYGDDAMSRLKSYYATKKQFYSLKSQKLFWHVYNNFLNLDEKEHCHFAELNQEYFIYSTYNKRSFFYDFVCSNLKLCIEFHGDHYHGNPSLYLPNDKLKGRGQTKKCAIEIWNVDTLKENIMRQERDYNYIVVWESEYDNNEKLILDKIEGIINESRIHGSI